MLDTSTQTNPVVGTGLSTLGKGALLAIAYFVAAIIGLQWAQVDGAGSPIWPAFGVSMAGLLLGGIRLWPAIVVGRLLAGIAVGSQQPLWAELSIALGNGLADAFAVALIQRFGGIDHSLSRMTDIWRLAGAVAISAASSALVGAGTLDLSSGLTPEQTTEVGVAWWFGNVVAGLTLTPLFLTLAVQRQRAIYRDNPAQAVLCLGSVLIASAIIFLQPTDQGLRSWHVYPLLVWAALAFSTSGAALGLTITAIIATVSINIHTGPIALFSESPIAEVMMLQQFVAISALTMLLLAAVADERRGQLALAAKNAELEAANRQLAGALATEELLTYEINHRVKNSLQMVASLLWLHSRHTSVIGAKQGLEEARQRIGVVATIHQALYAQGSHTNVDMTKILSTMGSDAVRAAGNGGRIAWKADVEELQLPINRAIALALIVNELLSNALKFSKSAGDGAKISLTLNCLDNEATLRLLDEGSGLPVDFDPSTAKGVGVRIVRALLDQLHGTIEFQRQPVGTVVEIVFAVDC